MKIVLSKEYHIRHIAQQIIKYKKRMMKHVHMNIIQQCNPPFQNQAMGWHPCNVYFIFVDSEQSMCTLINFYGFKKTVCLCGIIKFNSPFAPFVL